MNLKISPMTKPPNWAVLSWRQAPIYRLVPFGYSGLPIRNCRGGDDVRNFEPRKWLKFEDIDKSITELRAIYKIHPEWFEVPRSKSTKGKNEVDYSI